MRRHFLLPLLAVLAIAATSARGDDAASAKQVFDSLYGPRLKQVAGTIDRGDDLTLAKDMLGVAKTSTSTPALLVLLCESAHDLGMKHADGYATAAEAMTLLAETVAEKRAAARDKLVAVLTKQSTAGKPDERDAAGEALIDTLLAMGDEKMEAKKWNDAASDYRKALATATKKSTRVEATKAKLEAAMYRDRMEKQVARLQERILKDATDAPAAEELVRIFILEMDDALSAKSYLDRVKDAKLRAIADLAAKAVIDLPEGESLELGEWFATQVEQTPATAKLTVLRRAESLLTRFLSLHGADDALKIKAQVRLNNVQKMIAEASTPVQPTEPKLTLLEARYGSGNAWADVKSLLTNQIRNDRLVAIVHPSELGGDPAPGATKSLEIKYKVGDKVQLTSGKDGSAVVIAAPRKVTNDQGLTIIEAKFGAIQSWADVTSVVAKQVRGSRLSVKNDLALVSRDPIVGVHKTLYVIYTWRGRQYAQTAEDGATIEFQGK